MSTGPGAGNGAYSPLIGVRVGGIIVKSDPEQGDNTRMRGAGGSTSNIYDRESDQGLSIVFEELGVAENAVSALRDHGITNISEVLSRRDDLKNARLDGVKKREQRELYNFCLWHEDYYKTHERGTLWQEHFNEDAFEAFAKRGNNSDSDQYNASEAPILYGLLMNTLHEQNKRGLDALPPTKLQEVYKFAAKITTNALPTTLSEKCCFDIEKYAAAYLEAILDPRGGSKIKVVGGRTQAGKTTVKALQVAICNHLNCLQLTITKGVTESKDLRVKLMNLQGENWCTGGLDKTGNQGPKVFADTANHLVKAGQWLKECRDQNPNLRFCIAVDECDAMIRTHGRTQKMEQAYDAIMALKPSLTTLISATPIPTLIYLVLERGEDVELQMLGTSKDYAGIEEMLPLQDIRGNDVFLTYNEISHRQGVSYTPPQTILADRDTKPLFDDQDEKEADPKKRQKLVDVDDVERFGPRSNLEYIPYTSDSVMELYDSALSDPKKKGILVLDCTATRVRVGYNIFDKAVCVQDRYRDRGQDMVIVVNVGKGIFVRRPGFSQGRFIKGRTISEVLTSLDEEFGLDMPIFVFGYTLMRRCVSYRSTKRVPTHMALLLGVGHSNENYVQAIGRATFNGLESILKVNGHENVTILTPEDDFKMASKYQMFVQEVITRWVAGQTVRDAILGANGKFPDSVNFLRHTSRKVGQRKDHRARLPGRDAFDAPLDIEAECRNKRRRYENDTVSLGVMDAFLRLSEDQDIFQCAVVDILEEYNANCNVGCALTKSELNKTLTKLKRDNLVVKAGEDAHNATLWEADLDFIEAMVYPSFI